MVFTPSRVLAGLAFSAWALTFSPNLGAEVASRSPHGIFEIGQTAWTNPAVDGMRMQIKWSDVQPDSETEFDWSKIDTQVANAQTYQKQLGVSVTILSAAPGWLTAMSGVTTYQLPPDNGGHIVSMVLPWDPIVQPKVLSFITQLCLRYDGVVNYIVMGGLGISTESYMPDPADIGLDMTLSDAVAAWTDSSNKIIDTYASNLFSTPAIIAGGVPFSDPSAKTAFTDVINRAATLYGLRFGIMQWGLNASSTTGYLVNALIAQYSPTHPAGFQFLCPEAGGFGKTLGGTLVETLDAGIALGAQWIEVYAQDADNSDNAAALESASAAMAPPPLPGSTPIPQETLLNVSTRAKVLEGDGVTIGGFIVSGDIPKKVVLRALGPSLADAGVTGALADPVLDLYDSTGALLQENDNWTSPLPDYVVAGGLTPKNAAESLIATTLAPGSYTAVLHGKNTATGIALFELYDVDPVSSRISNLSTRGEAGSGSEAMIGGFIVGGTQPTEILARAIGPSLTDLGVAGALADPVLELHNSDGSLIAQNDNWRSDQEAEIRATTIAPTHNNESAILATLTPGSYTALVYGAGNSTGIALVEVYNLSSN